MRVSISVQLPISNKMKITERNNLILSNAERGVTNWHHKVGIKTTNTGRTEWVNFKKIILIGCPFIIRVLLLI
jgi:hypothetical protein